MLSAEEEQDAAGPTIGTRELAPTPAMLDAAERASRAELTQGQTNNKPFFPNDGSSDEVNINLANAEDGVQYGQLIRSKRSRTGYQGVCKVQKRYKASQWINKRQLYLGSYDSPQEAARAYAIAQDKKSRAIVVRQSSEDKRKMNLKRAEDRRRKDLKAAEDEWPRELKAANDVLKLWLNL